MVALHKGTSGLRPLGFGASARLVLIAFTAGAFVLSHPAAQAQLMDQLKGAVGSGQGETNGTGGMLGGLGGGGMPSVGQASPRNTAGVLQDRIQNNYVGGNSASSVKNSLMSKMTGSGQSTNDSGFKAGSSGLLQTGNGQGYSLGGDGSRRRSPARFATRYRNTRSHCSDMDDRLSPSGSRIGSRCPFQTSYIVTTT